jgi:hypothetical protein
MEPNQLNLLGDLKHQKNIFFLRAQVLGAVVA